MQVEQETGSAYRGIVARGIYLTSERLEAKYATKELSRSTKGPTKGCVKAVKRLARLCKKYPRVVLVFRWQGSRAGQPHLRKLVARAGSNHANCPVTRRSTSGGALMRGSHTWDGWSATQEVVTIASGESEFMAILKAVCQLLGALAMMHDLGLELEGVVETDSSAGLGMSSKLGQQKTKHIETKYLWVQQALRANRFKIRKCEGATNVADLMTKHVGHVTMLKHMKNLGLELRAGRPKISPALAEGATRVRLQALLMGLMIMQQLGESTGQLMTQSVKEEQETMRWKSYEPKEETSSWWTVLLTVLTVIRWEATKLLLEALMQEKLMGWWRKWFPVRPEVPEEPEVIVPIEDHEVGRVEGGMQQGALALQTRKVWITKNQNATNAKVHVFEDCECLKKCAHYQSHGVCW